jgi:hypothetical protein
MDKDIPIGASFRNVLRTTEHAVKDFRWVPFLGVTFLRASKKGDKLACLRVAEKRF